MEHVCPLTNLCLPTVKDLEQDGLQQPKVALGVLLFSLQF